MVRKHRATNDLPVAVLRSLEAGMFDLSAEPKRESFTSPHLLDCIEFARRFQLGELAVLGLNILRAFQSNSLFLYMRLY